MVIAGVDEAGRGPLAGPVVAACVTFKRDYCLPGLSDSKKISKEKREYLFDAVYDQAIRVGVGVVDSTYIDQYNILQATFKAMALAVGQLNELPDAVLVDGNKIIPGLQVRQIAVVKGDAFITSIAAASIVAKVTRDRIMDEFDHKYPVYGFCKHKGYGTKEHLNSLLLYGPSPIHRISFSPVRIVVDAGKTIQKAEV